MVSSAYPTRVLAKWLSHLLNQPSIRRGRRTLPAHNRHRLGRFDRIPLAVEPLENRILLAADPTATFAVSDPTPFIGSQVDLTVTFENTGTDTGYGPWADLFLDTTGVDGVANPDGTEADPFDGISFVGPATYLGAEVNTIVLTLTEDGIEHPFWVDASGNPVKIAPAGFVDEPGEVAAPAGFEAGDQLVVFELPFGSFTPQQPPVELMMKLDVSQLADLDQPLNIATRGGFRFGMDPLDNPATDPPIPDPSAPVVPDQTGDVRPDLLEIEKTFNGPENETATGPNFPREYTITIDIADGQTITDLDVIDNIPDNLQFVRVVSTSGNGSSNITEDLSGVSTTTPGGTVIVNFDQIVGTAGDSDATVVLEVFVPLLDANGNPVIPPGTGAAQQITNTVDALGDWPMPLDDRDPGGMDNVTEMAEQTFTARSQAIQKNVEIENDTGNPGVTPGDILKYTLDFQISDYFAFDNFVIEDVLSDGQRWYTDAMLMPELQVNGNPDDLPPDVFDSSNITITPNFSTPGDGVPTDGTDGTTNIMFFVSAEMARRGIDPRLLGGGVNPAGSSMLDNNLTNYNNGPTTGQVTFYVEVQNEFSDNVPPGASPNLTQGDQLGNTVMSTGELLDPESPTLAPILDGSGNPQEVTDGSTSESTLATSVLREKEVYALNGDTSVPSDIEIAAGDEVTFRLRYQLPTSNLESLVLTDFLPLPIFDASEVSTTFDPTISGDPPPAGTAKFGPDNTYTDQAGAAGVPAMSVDGPSGGNSVTFTWGPFDGGNDVPSEIDILLTVTVTDDPFADRLKLTNQVCSEEDSTNAGTNSQCNIAQVILTEPELDITKGVVATDNPAGVFQPTPVGPVSFNAPGRLGRRFSGTINSAGLAADPIDSNLSGVDEGDLVTFAITVENTGSGLKGAFDVLVHDTLPFGFEIPGIGAEGINLRVTDGGGRLLPFQLEGNGLFDPNGGVRLIDPASDQGALASGVVNGVPRADGRNILVITYDLRTIDNVPNQEILNIATLGNYAASEGGPDFTDPSGANDPTDNALVTTTNVLVDKVLVETEIQDTFNARNEAVVGELITYEVTITVPEGRVPDAMLVDRLDAGLGFVDVLSVDASPALVFTGDPTMPTVSGNARTITWDFGDIENNDRNNNVAETITIRYRALPLNVAEVQANKRLNNRARFSYSGGQAQDARAENVRIIEPQVQIDKSVVVDGMGIIGQAGDTIEYTIVLSNPPGPQGNTADAFDVTFVDQLPTNAAGSLIVNPIFTVMDTAGQVTAADFQLTGDRASGFTLETVSTADIDLPVDPARMITITVSGTLPLTVNPAERIINEGTVRWTSLNGDPGQRSTFSPDSTERTGAGGINDYINSDTAVAHVESVGAAKTAVATSEDATASEDLVTIGEIIRYRLEESVPASTTRISLELVDRLPPGLQFLDDGNATIAFVSDRPTGLISSTINDASPGVPPDLFQAGDENTVGGITPVFPVPAAAIEGGPFGNGTDVTFNLGRFINSETDPNEEFVVVEFNALVINVASNVTGTVLENDFVTRINGMDAVNPSPPVIFTVAEPSITDLDKTTQTPTGDAGDVIQFRTRYSNTADPNAAVAYDVRLVDTPPPLFMQLDPTSVQVFRNGTLITTGFTDNSSGNTVDVAVDEVARGDQIEIVYDVTLTAAVQPDQVIDNTADLTYTSLPGSNGTTNNPTGSVTPGAPGSSTGERDGSGGINNYIDSDTESVTIIAPEFSKFVVGTDISETTANQFDSSLVDLAIGEEVTYALVATLPEGRTNLTITDVVPPSMQLLDSRVVFIGSNIISPSVQEGDRGTITGNQVSVDFGPVINTPDNMDTIDDRIVILVEAQVLNVPANTAGDVLTNTGTLDYQTGTVTDTADVEVVEPDLEVIKEVVGDTMVDAGVPITYQATIRHTDQSTAIAFNVELVDMLPPELQLVPGSATIVSAPNYNSQFWAPPTISESGNTITLMANWIDHPDSPVSAGIDDEIVIQYQAIVVGPPDPNAPQPGEMVTNTAVVDYDSYFLSSDTDPDVSRNYQTDDDAKVTIISNSLSGNIYEDLNNNGILDPGEPLITQSVTITLTGTDHLGNPVSETVTTTTGMYEFTDLRPSDANGYTITQVNQPTGLLDGKDTPGTPFGGVGTVGGTPRDADAITEVVIPLGPNSPGEDYNFGEIFSSSLAGFVFLDRNDDGDQQAGEPGIPGVTVTLTGTDDTGMPVNIVTTTDANGDYSFTDLRPGTYTIIETQPPEYNDGQDTAGTVGGNAGNDIISEIMLPPGTDGTDYRFGELGTFLSGTVYYDQNKNAIREPGEVGLDSVEITLLDSAGNTVATTTTDANGFYEFTDLTAGDYAIVQTQPPGYGSSTPNTLDVTVPLAGLTDQDFGEILGGLAGTVYVDQNNNGTLDAGEPGIPGVTVTLTGSDVLGNAINQSLTTDANGNFEFTELFEGTYTLTETQPPEFDDGQDAAGTAGGTVGNDVISDIQLGPGVCATEYLFGELIGSISGTVFVDQNINALLDPGEAGIPFVEVQLINSAGMIVDSVITPFGGFYEFTGLRADTYTINVVTATLPNPVNLTRTVDPDGVGTPDVATVTLNPGENLTEQDFGYIGARKLGDRVWLDTDLDGNQDPSEVGIPGVTVELFADFNLDGLFEPNELLATTITGTDGFYAFDRLVSFLFQVRLADSNFAPGGPLAGLIQTFDIDGLSTPNQSDAFLGNVDRCDVDFGYGPLLIPPVIPPGIPPLTGPFIPLVPIIDEIEPVVIQTIPNIDPLPFGGSSLPLAALSGVVFHDRNDNGLQDDGEPGIPGVVITLEGTGSSNRVERTGNAGGFTFSRLRPGTYSLSENQLIPYVNRDLVIGDHGGARSENDSITGIHLNSGSFAQGYKFAKLRPGLLSGVVYLDANNNGIRDPGEAGIPGVEIMLQGELARKQPVGPVQQAALRRFDFSQTQLTDTNGFYEFDDLMPGTYQLSKKSPKTLVDGKTTLGTLGGANGTPQHIQGIELLGGYQGTDYNFAQLKPGTIAGIVFQDANNNGKQEHNEAALAGVTIILTGVDDQQQLVQEVAVTGEDGKYRFDLLRPGKYQVSIDHKKAPERQGRDSDQEQVPEGQAANNGTRSVDLDHGQKVQAFDLCPPAEKTADAATDNTPKPPPQETGQSEQQRIEQQGIEQQGEDQANEAAWLQQLDELDGLGNWAAGYLATAPVVSYLASMALRCRASRFRQLPWAS